ncbi:hypothetical protein cypCar_00044206, partial [Cyprinus carpio]
MMICESVVSSISVTGYSGGRVNITCRYDRKYTDNEKYFCRREWLTCFELIRTETKDKWVDSGRFSLFDDTTAAVFTVTFRDLSEQDSGTYWCGVEKPGLDPYTEVNLNVVTDSSPIVSLVPVLLVLVLIITLVLAGGDSSSQTGAGKHEAVSHTGCDYEEIQDTHKQLPTNPSDSSNTVYASAQLPTNPSDSSVYSTVQKASGDSQIFITSGARCTKVNSLVLLGDRGYGCQSFLLTPFTDPQEAQQAYNHARTRARVEMTFGLLKARFHCLHKLRVSPARACDITVACAVLHNVACLRKERDHRVPPAMDWDNPAIFPDDNSHR